MVRLICALCLAIVVWFSAQGVGSGRELEQWGSQGTVYSATISAYSCAIRDDNPMSGCHTFANGEKVEGAEMVVACPREWMNQRIFIQGYGSVKCVDVPRTGWYGDSPHIDLFFGTDYGAHDRAIQWGIQYREVRK